MKENLCYSALLHSCLFRNSYLLYVLQRAAKEKLCSNACIRRLIRQQKIVSLKKEQIPVRIHRTKVQLARNDVIHQPQHLSHNVGPVVPVGEAFQRENEENHSTAQPRYNNEFLLPQLGLHP